MSKFSAKRQSSDLSKQAQVLSVDAIVSFILFVFILVFIYGLFQSTNSQFFYEKESLLFEHSSLVLEQLVTTRGSPTNWTAYVSNLNSSNVTSIGLSSGIPQVLDWSRVQGLVSANASYQELRRVFGLSTHNFSLRVFMYNLTGNSYSSNPVVSVGILAINKSILSSNSEIAVLNGSSVLLVYEVYR